MIAIKKGITSQILLDKQEIASERNLSSYDAYALLNHSEKAQILNSLMAEQGHICASCMRKIPDERELPPDVDHVTIEHWEKSRPMVFASQNLLAAKLICVSISFETN